MTTSKPAEQRYAGFWRRLGAALIDGLLFIPPVLLVTLMETHSRPAAFLSAILNHTFFYFYVLPMTARYGATLGKMAVGIRVVPVDGATLTWRHVWLRSSVDLVLTALSLATTLVGLSRVPYETYQTSPFDVRSQMVEQAVPWFPWVMGLYVLWLVSEFVVIFLNPRRRAIHDFIAGTVVIVTRSQPPRSVVG